MYAKSTETPPYGAEKLPSREEPPEKGMIGTRYLEQIAAIFDTSEVFLG
jgi:hypothetical protein